MEGAWLLIVVVWMLTVCLILLIWYDLRSSLQEIHKALRIVPAQESPMSESFEVGEHEAALVEQEQRRDSEQRAAAIASRRSAPNLKGIR